MSRKVQVSIGIPVYKGKLFLVKTIESILAQDFQNFDVLISVDNNDLESAKVCKKYLSDPRFKLHIHQNHLGWVKNVSWLMKNQQGDYWFCLPQDDLITTSYVSKLVAHLESHPKAALAYSDIQSFGSIRKKIIDQPSLKGKPFDREINLIRHYLPAVAFRGLVRREVIIASQGGLRNNNMDGFCSDTTWMATIARYGELHRIAELLYRKRYHENNTHFSWIKHSPAWMEKAWAIHCCDMFLETFPVANTLAKKYKIFISILYRLTKSSFAEAYIKHSSWSKFKKIMYIIKFIWLLIPAMFLG